MDVGIWQKSILTFQVIFRLKYTVLLGYCEYGFFIQLMDSDDISASILVAI